MRLWLREHAVGLSGEGERSADAQVLRGRLLTWQRSRSPVSRVGGRGSAARPRTDRGCQHIDFYHLGENIYRAAWRIYGEGSKEGARWAKSKLDLAKYEGGRRLLKALKRARCRQKKPAARDALDILLRYVENHVGRMAYPELRKQGIDIGTGPQESACKNVIGRRLKGSGMRWAASNAEAMARLRALMYSTGSWEAFWSLRQLHTKAG